jgi:hypothetical protein
MKRFFLPLTSAFYVRSRHSSVGIVTTLRDRQLGNYASFLGKGKIFSPHTSGRRWLSDTKYRLVENQLRELVVASNGFFLEEEDSHGDPGLGS